MENFVIGAGYSFWRGLLASWAGSGGSDGEGAPTEALREIEVEISPLQDTLCPCRYPVWPENSNQREKSFWIVYGIRGSADELENAQSLSICCDCAVCCDCAGRLDASAATDVNEYLREEIESCASNSESLACGSRMISVVD